MDKKMLHIKLEDLLIKMIVDKDALKGQRTESVDFLHVLATAKFTTLGWGIQITGSIPKK